MKFKLSYSGENFITLMRKIGYFYLEEKTGPSFVRSLERGGYPRFHIYLEIDQKKAEIIFNLHLDQKRPIYKYAPAHAGEYEGKVVEIEAERIKQVLK